VVGKSFEIALCRECGQHYLVGREVDGYLVEAIRDPGRDDFAVNFFYPLMEATAKKNRTVADSTCALNVVLCGESVRPHDANM
jgi:hypothetical protein